MLGEWREWSEPTCVRGIGKAVESIYQDIPLVSGGIRHGLGIRVSLR